MRKFYESKNIAQNIVRSNIYSKAIVLEKQWNNMVQKQNMNKT